VVATVFCAALATTGCSSNDSAAKCAALVGRNDPLRPLVVAADVPDSAGVMDVTTSDSTDEPGTLEATISVCSKKVDQDIIEPLARAVADSGKPVSVLVITTRDGDEDTGEARNETFQSSPTQGWKITTP
jgi:hypothetical protein